MPCMMIWILEPKQAFDIQDATWKEDLQPGCVLREENLGRIETKKNLTHSSCIARNEQTNVSQIG
jgi:hypothetical protein